MVNVQAAGREGNRACAAPAELRHRRGVARLRRHPGINHTTRLVEAPNGAPELPLGPRVDRGHHLLAEAASRAQTDHVAVLRRWNRWLACAACASLLSLA